MNKTTTNLFLMLITVVAGTYFYIMYCSECGIVEPAQTASSQINVEKVTTVSPPKTPVLNYAVSEPPSLNTYSASGIVLNEFQSISAMSGIELFLMKNENSQLDRNGVFTQTGEHDYKRPERSPLKLAP